MTWFDTLDATWPAAETRHIGQMLLRRGLGGGQRVSAITTRSVPTGPEMTQARAVLQGWGQPMLFRVEDDQADLDQMLDRQGFVVNDPSVISAGPIDLPDPPQLGVMPVWPPLALAEEIWRDTGLAPARRMIMDRVTGPKTALLARLGDRPVGVAFAALDRGRVMLHALAVLPAAQRQGAGRAILLGAARWGHRFGATSLSMVTIRENLPANGLAASLGMQAVGHYHYRQERTKTGQT